MLPDISPVTTDLLQDESCRQQAVELSVLRIDKLHPVVSGNKLYKLRFFLEAACQSSHKTLLTFGGAFSNHLVATAFATQQKGLRSIGIVRGEKPAVLSPSLKECLAYGMQLQFVSRAAYRHAGDPGFMSSLQKEWGSFTLVPEGGYHPDGAKGAAAILQAADTSGYTHICTALGTGTTLAGLISAAQPGQTLIGIPVLKGMTDTKERLQYLLGDQQGTQWQCWPEEHWGGYAKKSGPLLDFMNQCYQQFQLPLDFVYTAKMFYAVLKKIREGYFPAGSRILCVHTGGLQGNRSLAPGTLLF